MFRSLRTQRTYYSNTWKMMRISAHKSTTRRADSDGEFWMKMRKFSSIARRRKNTGRFWDVSHGPFLSQSHKAETTWTYLYLLNSLVRWLAFDSGVISDIRLDEACHQYTWKLTQERDEISWSVPELGTVSKIKTKQDFISTEMISQSRCSTWEGSFMSIQDQYRKCGATSKLNL